jgi:hypothetical protein
MMDNLARIISHGFAIVVVILLGIGFIYRGELFPDIELPDFLVPESEKVADTGHQPDNRHPEMAVTQGVVEGEPVQATPSTAAAPPGEAPATAPEAEVATQESAPPDVAVTETASAPPAQERAETEIVSGTRVETRQAPVEEVPPPAAAEPGPTEGAGIGGTSSAAATDVVPAPVPSEEAPEKPQVEVPDYAARQAASATAETPYVPGEAAPTLAGSERPVDVEESYPVAGAGEGTAPTSGMAVPGSTPVTAAEMQSSAAGARQSPGSSATEAKPYELLAAAREAFWLHNYDDAEKNYRALTELEPQDPDGYGELGNMYFSQGRWEEAAAAYYEAGTRLISEGRLDPARELVKVIRGLNGKQADELDKLITSAASGGND